MAKARLISYAIWAGFLIALVAPLALAATSPLLAWREPIYILAGFAGVAAMALLLAQPLLAAGLLPGLARPRARAAHRWIGFMLALLTAAHLVGLWITSPPDVVDALLFRSPTPFSAWGVIAMWGVFAAALIAVFRKRLTLSPRVWRRFHMGLTGLVAISSVIHALQIEGTMEIISKTALCALVLGATLKAMINLRA